MKLSKDFLCKALPEATFQLGNKSLSANDPAWQALDRVVNVSIDSRTIEKEDLFVPLKGPNFDGHDFIKDAIIKGASGVLIGKDRLNCLAHIPHDAIANKLFVIVDDTLDAFITLAKAWRQRLTCPVVGITGSVGKTSTKEMIRTILKTANIDAFVSFKNYNNVFGLCYNILRIPETVKAAVVEVGINEKGEMAQLADILRPTIGLITNVGHAHLEGLGSLQTVASEKRQLFTFFSSQDVGIICGDQSLLNDISYAHPIARFGLKTKNQVQARKIAVINDSNGSFQTSFVLKWYGERASMALPGNHQGMILNALAASTLAYFLQVPFEAVVKGLSGYKGFENRFEMRKIRGNRGMLLNDCYNANPESMKAAIVAFSQIEVKGSKIAVLGDMLELGDREAYWHRQIGRVLCKVPGLSKLILVGERARDIARTAPGHVVITHAKDWKEAKQLLEPLLTDQASFVLVKASHGMRLDLMVKEIVE